MILAGDVGGTKTEVALLTPRRGKLAIVAQRRVASADYPSLEAILREFVAAQRAKVTAACFGVAGPVVNGRCQATNLPWVIDASTLQQRLKIKRVTLLNDLAAMAYGVLTLPPKSLAVLNAGKPQPRGTIGIIAAGTGLGESALVWDGRAYRAVASEGGHCDFAPCTELEDELLRYLRHRHGHVSYERIVSGPGKVAVYEFLREKRIAPEPEWLAKRLAAGDPSPVISEVALEGGAELCVKALELFISIYGAEAGNLALKVLATGGVYIGGGIAPTIVPMLKNGVFMRAFVDKGRLGKLLASVPVRVVLEPKAGLLGAAAYAAHPVA